MLVYQRLPLMVWLFPHFSPPFCLGSWEHPWMRWGQLKTAVTHGLGASIPQNIYVGVWSRPQTITPYFRWVNEVLSRHDAHHMIEMNVALLFLVLFPFLPIFTLLVEWLYWCYTETTDLADWTCIESLAPQILLHSQVRAFTQKNMHPFEGDNVGKHSVTKLDPVWCRKVSMPFQEFRMILVLLSIEIPATWGGSQTVR